MLQRVSLELVRTPVDRALEYAQGVLGHIPRDFAENYDLARQRAHSGHMHRRDMPVIEEEDIAPLRKMMADIGVSTRDTWLEPMSLRPVQRQIYITNCIPYMADPRRDRRTLETKHLVVSSDRRIMDGHHRWLSGMLRNPRARVRILHVDLAHNHLLPFLRILGDQEGHRRNP
jgi:hypothetical protein